MRDKLLSGLLCCLSLIVLTGFPAVMHGQEEFVEEPLDAQPYVDGGGAVPVEEAQPVEEEPYEEPYVEEEAPPPPPPIRPSAAPAAPPRTRTLPTRPIRPGGQPTPPGPRPVTGPPAAAEPGKGPEGEEQLEPGAPIRFDCDNCELIRVIETLARLTGKNFDVDPNIGSTPVTIISHNPIPPEMAFELLESILQSRGFSMIESLDGNLIKILPQQNAFQDPKVPLAFGPDGLPAGADTLSTHIVPVQYADATEVATALKLLGSPTARVDVYAPTNTLVMTDVAEGLRRMFSFLEVADVAGRETEMEIFLLEYTRAEVLQAQLEQVLLDEGGGAAGAIPGQPAQRRPIPTRPTRTVRPTVPGQETSTVIGSAEETLRMVPDERLNALIVVATSGMMERVRDLIVKLDTPTPYEANNLHIYELLNADAEQVETALQGIVGTAPRAQTGGGGAAGGGGGAAPAGGGGPTAEVSPFERKIQITRYDQTNSLLIVASPQDYKHLESFIARLDVPQRQVHVDSMIMRVRTTNDFTLDVDAAGISGNDGFGITNSNNIASLAAGLAPVTETANALAGSPQAALASGLLTLGASNTFTAGLFDEITVEIDGVDVDVPFVPLLMTALETLTDVEVLSQPSLVTVDNEEASIVIGQEVPFIVGTGSPRTSDEGNLISTGFTRVQREEVGVKLKVTPQISEGDYVALQLEVEKSNVAANPVGDVNILGPTTDKSIVQNKVVVKDGATAVIGGLTEDTVDRSRSHTPVLGELPVLGWLFGRRSNNQSRSNIVVLVTPHIIKEGVDYERVTEYKVGEYQDAHMDLLFDKGFFEKLKRKRDMRKNFRPTYDRAEAVSGRPTMEEGEQFGRGDIKR